MLWIIVLIIIGIIVPGIFKIAIGVLLALLIFQSFFG